MYEVIQLEDLEYRAKKFNVGTLGYKLRSFCAIDVVHSNVGIVSPDDSPDMLLNE